MVHKSDKNSQQDWDDLNNELSGLEVGRLQRFVLGSDIDVYGETRKKKEERRHLSQIEQLLLDEAYQAALKDAMRSVHDTRSAIYDALKDSSQAINHAELRIRDLRENASTLPDGTLVFLDKNGNATTVDKRQLSDEELAQVSWNDNAPRWEEYQQSLEEMRALQERHTQLQRHNERVDEIERELKDHPDSQERVEELNEELQDINAFVNAESRNENTLQISASTPSQLPNLGL